MATLMFESLRSLVKQSRNRLHNLCWLKWFPCIVAMFTNWLRASYLIFHSVIDVLCYHSLRFDWGVCPIIRTLAGPWPLAKNPWSWRSSSFQQGPMGSIFWRFIAIDRSELGRDPTSRPTTLAWFLGFCLEHDFPRVQWRTAWNQLRWNLMVAL